MINRIIPLCMLIISLVGCDQSFLSGAHKASQGQYLEVLNAYGFGLYVSDRISVENLTFPAPKEGVSLLTYTAMLQKGYQDSNPSLRIEVMVDLTSRTLTISDCKKGCLIADNNLLASYLQVLNCKANLVESEFEGSALFSEHALIRENAEICGRKFK